MGRDLAARGVPDGKEFGGERGGPRDPTVVAAELHEEEDEDAAARADCGDVEQVLDVSVPHGIAVGTAFGGRGDRWVHFGYLREILVLLG